MHELERRGDSARSAETPSSADRTQAGERTMQTLSRFLNNEQGATAIEYALIASLIAVFIIAAVSLVGTQVSTVFTEIGNALK
jgi:pilus assembly protein Flp/PilA